MKLVYELRDEAPAVLHFLNHEGDGTLCDEYIVDEPVFVSEHVYVTQQCPVCVPLARERALSEARSFVARELGVDESEVF